MYILMVINLEIAISKNIVWQHYYKFFFFTQLPYSRLAIINSQHTFAFNTSSWQQTWPCYTSWKDIHVSLCVTWRKLPVKGHTAKHPKATHQRIEGRRRAQCSRASRRVSLTAASAWTLRPPSTLQPPPSNNLRSVNAQHPADLESASHKCLIRKFIITAACGGKNDRGVNEGKNLF